MKKFHKVLAILFCLCTALCFSGCAFFDVLNNFGNIISGFGDATVVKNVKVLSKPAEYPFEMPYADYSRKIMQSLVDYFGTGDSNNNEYIGTGDSNNSEYDADEDLKDKGATDGNIKIIKSILATDRIRGQFEIQKSADTDTGADIYRIRQILDKSQSLTWNWHYVDNIIKNLDYKPLKDINEDDYGLRNQISSAYENYVLLYSIALEINMYRITVGEEPFVFTPQLNGEVTELRVNETNQTIFLSVAGDTKFVDRETCQPLIDTLEQYKSKGTYIGTTERDREMIVEYILDEVIGEKVVSSKACNIFGSENEYVEVVTEIVNTDPSLTPSLVEGVTYARSFFSTYPASYLKDYEGTNFYIGSGVDEFGNKVDNQFDHIPLAEYQSMLLSLEEEMELSMLMLTLHSDYDMDITIRVRYFDKNSNTLYEIAKQEVAVKGGEYNAGEDTLMIDLTGKMDTGTVTTQVQEVKIGAFDDSMEDGLLKAPDGKYVTGEMAKYYNILDSYSGFGAIGVFNEKLAQSSYLELAFDVKKSSATEYKPFKACLVGVIEDAE